jgi:hypothetical protein
MPTYTVTDPQTGKTLQLIGDSPPTESELNRIFGHTSAPTTALGRAAAANSADNQAREQAAAAAAPYWIAGVAMAIAVCIALIWKLMKSRPLQAIPRAVRSASKMKDQMAFECSDQDSELFALAEEEMISGQVDKGTWAQALVKAGGNEEKRRADYIVLRVKKMRLANS